MRDASGPPAGSFVIVPAAPFTRSEGARLRRWLGLLAKRHPAEADRVAFDGQALTVRTDSRRAATSVALLAGAAVRRRPFHHTLLSPSPEAANVPCPVCSEAGRPALVPDSEEARTVWDRPIYTIGVVTQATGLTLGTLRVWERRYGFPRPARLPGGARRYSPRQVAAILWVRGRAAEGLRLRAAIQPLLDHATASDPATLPPTPDKSKPDSGNPPLPHFCHLGDPHPIAWQ